MSTVSDFFADSDSEKVLLIEVKTYITGTGETTFYLSSAPHITEPDETPPNQIYDNKLTGQPYFTRRISEAFYGKSTAGFGDLIIDNSEEGDFDDWLNYGWDGRDITIKIGDASWAHDDYVTILIGKVQRLSVSSDTQLTLEIRDLSQLLDAPAQNNLLSSPSPSEGQPKPLCYGVAYNVKAVLLSSATLTYQVHDGAITAINAVYDNGVQLTAGVGYTVNLSAGTFALTASPAGDITADVSGGTNATYGALLYAGEIIYDIITRTGGVEIGSSIIDTTKLNAVDAARPYQLGLYITERVNALDLLDQIAHSVGAWYGFSRDGQFEMGLLEEPAAGIPLDGLDMYGDLSIRFMDTPSYRVAIGHTKNWFVQSSDTVAGAVTTDRRAWLEAEYRTATAEDLTVLTKHQFAAAPEQISTLITSSADAATEAVRVLNFNKVQRFSVKLSTFSKPFALTMGDNFTITDDRFGFSGGLPCKLVGLTEYFIDNQTELELFR